MERGEITHSTNRSCKPQSAVGKVKSPRHQTVFLVHGLIEQAFDRQMAVTVPCETETKPPEWKFLPLDTRGNYGTALLTSGKETARLPTFISVS